MRTSLATILPPYVRSSESGGEYVVSPFDEEVSLVADAVRGRQAEFFAGRACARRALGAFGVPDAPFGRAGRRPVWSAGFVGSITHCAGYRAAAVARVRDVVMIGIDAEPDGTLPASVLELVASPAERRGLAALPCGEGAPNWDRLLFSAKESVFKAWSPVVEAWLGFEDAEVAFVASGQFEAHLRSPLVAAGEGFRLIRGSWMQSRGLPVTTVVMLAR